MLCILLFATNWKIFNIYWKFFYFCLCDKDKICQKYILQTEQFENEKKQHVM